MRWMMIALFMMVTVVFAGEEMTPEKRLEQLSTNEAFNTVRTAYLTNKEKVAEEYIKGLKDQQEKATKAGDLDTLQLITKELETVHAVDLVASTTEFKGTSLRLMTKKYNTGIKKAGDDYIKLLNKLVSDLTKEKKIDDALMVKKYVEDLKIRELICGVWKETKSTTTHQINADGTAIYLATTEKREGKWKVVDKSLIIEWSHGFKMTAEVEKISVSKTTLTNFNPNGINCGLIDVIKQK
jgi:hypothetical protein